MEFKIKYEAEPISDVYEVQIFTIHADETSFETVEIGFFHKDEEEDLLIDLIETLNRMKEFGNWTDNYPVVEGFNRWFGSEKLSEEEWEALGSNYRDIAEGLTWPCNIHGKAARMETFAITFADWAGRECPVEIVY